MERYYNLQNLRADVQNLDNTAIMLCDTMENSERNAEQKNLFDITNYIFKKSEKIWGDFNNILPHCIEDDNCEKFIFLIAETITFAKILRYLLQNNCVEYEIDDLSVICKVLKEKTNYLLKIIKDVRLTIYPNEIVE